MSKAAFDYAKLEILDIMKTADPPMKPLLSEDTLCEHLDVSRGTLREILRALEAEGFISKRHGEGNFVHNSVLNVNMCINQVQDFHQMIESAGHTSAFFVKKVETQTCTNEETLQRLQLPSGSLVVYINGLYLADSTPAIYCKLSFPKTIFHDRLPDYTAMRDIGKLFAKHSKQGIEQTLVQMHSTNCNKELAEMLQLEEGKAVLYWEETFYNYTDDIIGTSDSYFSDRVINPSMILKNR